MARSEFITTFVVDKVRWRCLRFRKNGRKHYGYFPQHSHTPIWSEAKLSSAQIREVLAARQLKTSPKPAPCSDDLILWPCGTWCYRHELSEFTHKSDDYEEVVFGSARYELLCKELSDE